MNNEFEENQTSTGRNPQYYQNGNVQQVQMPPVQTAKPDKLGYAVAAFILGVVSFFLFPCGVNYVTAILGIILAIVQMVKNKKKAMAVVAILICVFAMTLSTLLWVGVAKHRDQINIDDLEEYMDSIMT